MSEITPEMVEIANRAVEKHLNADGTARWGTAQAFACAITALATQREAYEAKLREARRVIAPFAHACFETDGWPDGEAFTLVLRPDDEEGLRDGSDRRSLITARHLRRARAFMEDQPHAD